jgi:hypothetical protein
MRFWTIAAACTALLCAPPALAQEVTISPSDTVQTVLAGQKGKRPTLRLRGGQEISGVVRDVSSRVVVLGGVAGREFFDAVVPLEAIDAVLVRTRDK